MTLGETGTVERLNVSAGGVPKLPIESAWARANGLEGDRQRYRRFHGGPMRALCLYSADLIDRLRAEGHPIAPGTTGENVTIRGLDWTRVVPGTRLRLGDVLVEVTSYAAPCKTIAASFAGEAFTRIGEKRHRGWSRVYVKVLEAGVLRVGDAVAIVNS